MLNVYKNLFLVTSVGCKDRKMSDSDVERTPPELREAAEKVILNLLPEKSKSRYEKAYRAYRDWCNGKGVTNITSENVVLAYFGELAKNKKPSTLWSLYSMIRSTMNIKDNVDISRYAKVIAYLKKQNVGYKAKKSNTFTKQDIENFLKSAPFEFLPQKAALIIGVFGACRTGELFKMRTNDVDLKEDKVFIVILDTKTHKPRAFVVIDKEWIEILKQYINLRKNVEGDRFFLQLRYGKLTKQPFGHNSLAQFPKKIANYLQLNNVDTYSGHCFRRTATTLFANSGGDVLNLKRLGGWKSGTVAEGYVDNSLDSQIKIAGMLFTTAVVDGNAPVPGSSFSRSEFNFSNEDLKQGVSLNIEGHDNSTFNFYFNANPNNKP